MAVALLALPLTAIADVELVRNRTSEHCIHHAADAPYSVSLAAAEIQEYVKKASGVVLPIVVGNTVPNCPVISLGESAALKAAHFEVAKVPLEGYQISVADRNIYLFGIDTQDGARTPEGGTSNGTLNAAYTFLEEFVGVRWLLPGEVGEYVPRLDTVHVPSPLTRIDKPGFANRRIPYIQNDDPLVAQWLRRQKQGYSLELRHGHAWHELIPPLFYNDHPEWFAMIGGVRSPPVGDRYKLETTNTQLVEAFSARVLEQFQDSPERYSSSISPTDSANWSTSPESVALYDKDPHDRTSMTRLVLEFYSNVAGLVGRSLPEKKLCGYVYADYLYPPSRGIPALPPNLCLVVAPSFSYGYGLHRSAARADWGTLIPAWGASLGTTGYYDLPTVFFPDTGAPNPLGIEILKFLYPRVAAAGYKGVYVYGVGGWGHGGVTNYLLAKLNWNPYADAAALAQEFFRLAYGIPASVAMAQLYAILDSNTKNYYRLNPNASATLDRNVLIGVYLKSLPAIEGFFRDARSAAATDVQRLRLDMFQMNLAELYRRLVREGLIARSAVPSYIAEGPNASTAREPSSRPDVALAVSEHLRRPLSPDVESVSVAPADDSSLGAAAPPDSRFLLRGPTKAVLYPLDDGMVSVDFSRLRIAGEDVRYLAYDGDRRVIAEGAIESDGTISFQAKAGQALYLKIGATDARYHMNVRGARYALSTSVEGRGIHYVTRFPATYFYVPGDFGEFSVTISTEAIDESAAADLIAPNGQVVASLDTSDQLAVQAKAKGGESGGFWTLAWKKPERGATDDAWVAVDERLPPWIVVAPHQAVVVHNTR